MPSHDFALRQRSYGGPDVLVLEPENVAMPGPGQAVLRQTAVGVNFLDIYHRRGDAKPVAGLPFINGFEGVGVIEALGEGAEPELRVGQRVGYTLAAGAYASRRLVPSSRLVPLPDDLDDHTAAAVLLKGTTAEYLVRRLRLIGPGDRVLVHAAAGGVGLLLTQWVRHLGGEVVGVVGTAAKAELARDVGRCNEVIVRDSPDIDFAGRVEALWGPTPLSVVYDGVAGPTLHRSMGLLGPRGLAVVTGSAGGAALPLDVHSLKARSLSITSPSLPHFTGKRADLLDSCKALFAALSSGAILPPPISLYPLRDAAQAHAALEGRRTAGALVLTVD